MGIRRKYLSEDSRIMINGDDDDSVPSSSSTYSSSDEPAKPGELNKLNCIRKMKI